MNDFVTDEQQVEALKKWWSENGTYLIAGVVLGLGILFAWDWWKNHQENEAMAASDVYISVIQAVKNGSLDQALTLNTQLHEKYSGTPYASLGNLALAKLQVENNAIDPAADNLQWVIDNAKQDEFVEIATIRKIRMLLASSRLDEGEKLLQSNFPAAYISIVEELRGDLFSAKGDTEAARVAYDKALLTSRNPSEFLQLKRDALGKDVQANDDKATGKAS